MLIDIKTGLTYLKIITDTLELNNEHEEEQQNLNCPICNTGASIWLCQKLIDFDKNLKNNSKPNISFGF